jgi:hypothetical protein
MNVRDFITGLSIRAYSPPESGSGHLIDQIIFPRPAFRVFYAQLLEDALAELHLSDVPTPILLKTIAVDFVVRTSPVPSVVFSFATAPQHPLAGRAPLLCANPVGLPSATSVAITLGGYDNFRRVAIIEPLSFAGEHDDPSELSIPRFEAAPYAAIFAPSVSSTAMPAALEAVRTSVGLPQILVLEGADAEVRSLCESVGDPSFIASAGLGAADGGVFCAGFH